jgi:glycosyltransferase involved in cell wall biosynthesis
MTHDPRFGLRFQKHAAFFRVAVVYDFIPLDWPGYLPTVASRMGYLGKLARLREFDLFFPISEYTAWRTEELLGVSRGRLHVTGASVRRAFYEIRRGLEPAPPAQTEDPYFLIVLGPDARKNPEVAVKAVQRLRLVYGRRIVLKVVGHYEERQKPALLQLAGHAEGRGFLEFYPGIPDEELVSLLVGAVATIVPSHIEGFSLPVVEAAVCGCPAIASTCAAHLELVDRPEALFPSCDSTALSEKLDSVLCNSSLRAALVESQAHLVRRFHEEAVGNRFWTALDPAFDKQGNGAVVGGRKRPRLAFLSPYPPDQSGVARYTAMTIRAGEGLFQSDLYTDAARPLAFDGSVRDAGRVSLAPLLDGRYDGVISVLANSHFCAPIFDVFERYGGPCILHDSRLIQIYIERLGREQFLELAGRIVGRPVEIEEVGAWLQDRNPPSLLLDPIVQRASPLIVHTVTQQAEIQRRYGANPAVIPCCPTMFFSDEDLTVSAQQAARGRHGISPDSFLISTFGIVAPEKGMETCVLAAELLRGWNIPAELYFVGGAGPHKGTVDVLAERYGVAENVHCAPGFLDDAMYRDFLIASDVGLQLRTYGFGQFSAALTDCVSAGLPCVANSDLANSCDAPSYVSTVPDSFSPLQVAEQLALLWEARTKPASIRDSRQAYIETHNFESYGRRLLEILGIS